QRAASSGPGVCVRARHKASRGAARVSLRRGRSGKAVFMEICEASRYSSAVPLSPDKPPVTHVTSGNDVTQLLKRWRKGSPEAEAALMERVHGELRRLAAGYMRRERAGRTLQPTAVVNEAYMRLLPQRGVSWENRAHFFGIAAKMMRRVLVDHARRKRAIKRDAGPAEPV